MDSSPPYLVPKVGFEPTQAAVCWKGYRFRLPGSPGLPTMIPPPGYTNSPSLRYLVRKERLELSIHEGIGFLDQRVYHSTTHAYIFPL